MTIPPLNLAEYHQKVVEAIAGHFGTALESVHAYPTFEETIPRSVSIELDAVYPEGSGDIGTGQFHAELRFSAYVVVPFQDEAPKLLVRKLALNLVGMIRGKRFGCPGAGAAAITSALPDDFTLPGKTGRAGSTEEYEVWRVEWSMNALVNESVWPLDAAAVPFEIIIKGLEVEG